MEARGQMRLWWLLSVPLMGVPAPAWAGARDDATAGAYRCAVIGDLRPWLDCFYGAAQPVRAKLGLPSAPAAQVRIAPAPPAGTAPPGDLRLREEVMSTVLRCYAKPEDRAWLDCYYGAAEPVRTRLGLPAGPKPAPGAPQSSPAMPVPARSGEDQFGLSDGAGGRRAEQITSRMTAYEFTRFRIFTVVLANGQVWRQLSGDISYAHWNKPPGSYLVTIRHGAFRSFNLQVKDIPTVFKVEHVR
jgi:hypothetical protein